MNKKLWAKLFFSIAVIFAAFVIIISVANSSLLTSYFTLKEKALLIETSKEMASLDIGNKDEITSKMSEINNKYNFDIEIYEKKRKNHLYHHRHADDGLYPLGL